MLLFARALPGRRSCPLFYLDATMLADLHRQSADTTMDASTCPLFTQSQYTKERRLLIMQSQSFSLNQRHRETCGYSTPPLPGTPRLARPPCLMSGFRSIECTHAVAQGQKRTFSSTWCHLITTPMLFFLFFFFFCTHQTSPEMYKKSWCVLPYQSEDGSKVAEIRGAIRANNG